jgi:hypothetical protein
MKEYIEREYLENMVYYHLCKSNGAEHYAYGVIRGELRTAPVADVIEVKHAYWKPMRAYPSEYMCSECGELWNGFMTPYCHECGAKMDGGKV